MPRDSLHFIGDRGRFKRWLIGLTDGRLSAYMLLLAGLIAAILFIVDRKLFGS